MEEIIKTEEAQNNNQSDQPDNYDSDLTGLADRWTRLAAVIIDGLILLFPYSIVNILLFGYDAYMDSLNNANSQIMARSFTLGSLVYLLINGYPLYKKGQTIGKKIMDIKIVDMNNNVPPLFYSFFVRYFIFSVLYFIPFVKIIAMLDPFFIFSQNRRCLHDRLAGTKVVEVEIQILSE